MAKRNFGTLWLCALSCWLGCSGRSAEQAQPVQEPSSVQTPAAMSGRRSDHAGEPASTSAGSEATTVRAGAGGEGGSTAVSDPQKGAAGGSQAGSAAGATAEQSAGAPAVGPSDPQVAGSSGAAVGGSTAQPSKTPLPKVTSTDGPGPFETVSDLRAGPRGQSGVFRPAELGKDGLLHPVFVWGCGGMATPSSYMSELTRIASHGFVVVAEVSNIGDDGAPLLAALDWVIAENERSDSQLYQKLDTSRIGLGGHSIGSVNSFLAGPDPRWFTTVHVAGGSLDNVNDPSAPTTGQGGKSLIHPTAYVCSESDIFGNVEKTEKDYDNTTAPVFFTIMAGAEHIGAVSEGLPVIIAWLRWQLADEAERRGDFLDAQGMFATGRYSTRTKNW